jgi:hypothetical protein
MCSVINVLISMPMYRPSPVRSFAGLRDVARLQENAARKPRSCVTTWINWDAGADLEAIHYSGRVYRLKGVHQKVE